VGERTSLGRFGDKDNSVVSGPGVEPNAPADIDLAIGDRREIVRPKP
jgi:hypothetical protein